MKKVIKAGDKEAFKKALGSDEDTPKKKVRSVAEKRKALYGKKEDKDVKE